MNAIHIALPIDEESGCTHAGLVFHLKVGEKCCWRLTFGPRDLAKEQRKHLHDLFSGPSSSILWSFALEHLRMLVIIIFG